MIDDPRESVKLVPDSVNEVVFDVKIIAESPLTRRPVYRLVVEDEKVAYMFTAALSDNRVVSSVDTRAVKIRPGRYPARLEAVIEGRLLVPLELDIVIGNPTTAEARVAAVGLIDDKPAVAVTATVGARLAAEQRAKQLSK